MLMEIMIVIVSDGYSRLWNIHSFIVVTTKTIWNMKNLTSTTNKNIMIKLMSRKPWKMSSIPLSERYKATPFTSLTRNRD